MAKASGKIPSRTIEPVFITYCKLTKTTFKQLVTAFQKILSETYEKELELAIEIEGFDEPFASVDDVVSELTNSDWSGLRKLEARFYLKGEYERLATMSFGQYWNKNEGLRIEILKGATKDKLTARESMRLLAPDYERKMVVGPRLFGTIVGVCGAILYSLILYLGGRHSHNHHAGYTAVDYLIIAGASFFPGGLVGFWATQLHRKVIPPVELLSDNDKTRLSRLLKICSIIVGAVGLVSAILGILVYVKT